MMGAYLPFSYVEKNAAHMRWVSCFSHVLRSYWKKFADEKGLGRSAIKNDNLHKGDTFRTTKHIDVPVYSIPDDEFVTPLR